jgi:hypothetical protein
VSFQDEGFHVAEGLVPAAVCSDLFREIVRALPAPARDRVHSADFRAHCPLPLEPAVRYAVSASVQTHFDFLYTFLGANRKLVELSSITVFPGASAQPLHADQSDPAKRLVSIFINPFPTEAGVGALEVIPGSHLGPGSANRPPLVLALPAGSLVFMDSRLQHRGTANRSIDRIRPVVYCGFGEDDLDGPVYSILSEYKGAMRLDDFQIVPLRADHRPRFVPGVWAAPSFEDADRPLIVFLEKARAVRKVRVSGADTWQIDFVKQFAVSSGAKTCEELARGAGVGIDVLVPLLTEWWRFGFVAW